MKTWEAAYRGNFILAVFPVARFECSAERLKVYCNAERTRYSEVLNCLFVRVESGKLNNIYVTVELSLLPQLSVSDVFSLIKK